MQYSRQEKVPVEGGSPHGKRTCPPLQPSPWIQVGAHGPVPPSSYWVHTGESTG